MKTCAKQILRCGGFTLIEMLVAIGIVAILIGMLIPALGLVRSKAAELRQEAQFTSIEIALDAFRDDYGDYPPSDPAIHLGPLYYGALQLAEAIVGRDGFGFHQNSIFRKDGTDGGGIPFYKPDVDTYIEATFPPANWQAAKAANIAARWGPYLELETANAVLESDVYASGGSSYLLADTYGLVTHRSTGKKTGMPILYYKAYPLRTEHYDKDKVWYPWNSNAENIYECAHNWTYSYASEWPPPWDGSQSHKFTSGALPPAGDDKIFYDRTLNPNFTSPPRPYRANSFILHSAGPDGLYGTVDDVYNFD